METKRGQGKKTPKIHLHYFGTTNKEARDRLKTSALSSGPIQHVLLSQVERRRADKKTQRALSELWSFSLNALHKHKQLRRSLGPLLSSPRAGLFLSGTSVATRSPSHRWAHAAASCPLSIHSLVIHSFMRLTSSFTPRGIILRPTLAPFLGGLPPTAGPTAGDCATRQH